MRRSGCIGLLMGLTFLTGSCQRFQTLDREVKRLERSYFMQGRMAPGLQIDGDLWAFVLAKDESGIVRVVDVNQIGQEGVFSFMLPPGDHYYVGVAEDRNGNEQRDPGERLWLYGDPSPVPFADGRSELLTVDLNFQIHIDDADLQALRELRAGRSLMSLESGGFIPVAIGEIGDLEDSRFSQEMGETGLWKPETFLHEGGYGVYFLEEYDPERIPVLFVNGAGGTPRHFQKLFERLDGQRYQFWFFHYPTGLPLRGCARTLNRIIEVLHDTHRFPALHVVAHSMGGLVSRSFILQNQENLEADYIRRYVTISTPWNGHELAALGVKNAPATIPSWRDMQTNSEFIQDLLSRELKEPIQHHLVFSFKASDSLLLPSSNDGAVSLASQLDPRAQDQAVTCRGFNLAHVPILADETVAAWIAARLSGH